MNITEQLAIVRSLVGPVSEAMYRDMCRNIQMYLTPDVALFIPFLDYCDYAITPRHTHPGYSFIYAYAGPVEVRVRDEIRKSPYAGKPCICAFSPDVPHEEIMQEQFKSYIAVVIRKEYFERELRHYPVKYREAFEGSWFQANTLIMNALKRFIVEYDTQLPCRERLLCGLALEITHLLIRHCHELTDAEVRISQKMEINQLIGFLNEEYARKITIEDMAKQANLSPSHFTRIFKEETGMTPVDFLNDLRVQKAKRYLLDGERSITDVALACGFSSSSYFTNCFAERIGMAPRAFRKKQLP
jgi:AraC family transcriptional regulator